MIINGHPNPGGGHGWNSRKVCQLCVIKTGLAGRCTGHSSNKRMEIFNSGHLDRYKYKQFGDHSSQQSCSWVQLKVKEKSSALCLTSPPPSRGYKNFHTEVLLGTQQEREKEIAIKKLAKMRKTASNNNRVGYCNQKV